MTIEELHQYLHKLMSGGVDPQTPVEVEVRSPLGYGAQELHYETVTEESVYVAPGDNDPNIDRLIILPVSSLPKE